MRDVTVGRVSRNGLLLFATLSIFWGIPYALISVAVEDIHPLQVAFARCLIAALVLVPLAGLKQLRLALHDWRPVTLFAIVEVCVPWWLLGFAEQHVSSSVAGVAIATVPLAMTVVVVVLGEEVLTGNRLAGLVIGFVGVCVLLFPGVGGAKSMALLALVGVVVGYSCGPLIITQRLNHLPSLGIIALSMTIASTLYLPFLPYTPPPNASVDAWLAVGVLGVVCSAFGFVAMFALIKEVGATRGSLVTYVNPLVAIMVGFVALGESITINSLVALPLILSGAWLAMARAKPLPTSST